MTVSTLLISCFSAYFHDGVMMNVMSFCDCIFTYCKSHDIYWPSEKWIAKDLSVTTICPALTNLKSSICRLLKQYPSFSLNCKSFVIRLLEHFICEQTQNTFVAVW